MAYSDDALSEATRQAAGDLGRAYGEFVTIEDLDSAAATNVDVLDEDLLIRGAAGFAARMRAVDRADSANLGQRCRANLLEWSKNTLYYFDDKLRGVKQRRLQQSTTNPASSGPGTKREKIGRGFSTAPLRSFRLSKLRKREDMETTGQGEVR